MLEPELLLLLACVRCSPPDTVSTLAGGSVRGVAGSEPLFPGSLGESCGDDSIHTTTKNKLCQQSVAVKRPNLTIKVRREQRLMSGCEAAPCALLGSEDAGLTEREGGAVESRAALPGGLNSVSTKHTQIQNLTHIKLNEL